MIFLNFVLVEIMQKGHKILRKYKQYQVLAVNN